MFKSLILRPGATSASSFSLWSLFLVIGVLLLATTANASDDRYYRIYGIIEQGDALAKAGQRDKAVAKYVEAEKGLREIKQYYPNYNPKLIAARLSYLTEQIAVLSKPPVVEIPTDSTSGAATPTAVVPGRPQIKLIEAGATPQEVYRLKAETGDKQIANITAKISTGMSAPGMEGEMMNMPAIKMKATLTIKDVTTGGDVNYEVRVDEVDVVAEASVPAPLVEGMKASLAGMKGLVIASTVTDRLLNKKVEAKIPPGTDAQTRASMEQMKESFANPEFILPEEAIGVGAKWEVKEKAKTQGMTIDQTTTHELVSIEGDTLIVKSSTTQSAANQKIPNPLMPSLKVDMTKMTGSATGTSTVSLKKILPVKATSNERAELNLSVNAGGQKQVMTMTTETRSTLETE